MKTPFKSKEKVEQIRKKIEYHRLKISFFNRKIKELEKNDSEYDGFLNSIGQPLGCSSITINYPSGITYNKFSQIWSTDTMNTTSIKYLNEDMEELGAEVIDDIFQSVLGNYYLITNGSQHIFLNRVIDFDDESNIGKWYNSMSKNFERGKKLERVLKDENKKE
jgi:hypothetical protein